MPNVLSPNQVHVFTLRQFKDLNEKSRREIASPDAPEDHENIREIRKRLVELVREFDELGMLD